MRNIRLSDYPANLTGGSLVRMIQLLLLLLALLLFLVAEPAWAQASAGATAAPAPAEPGATRPADRAPTAGDVLESQAGRGEAEAALWLKA